MIEDEGMNLSATLTELYTATANTLDRIIEELGKGELTKQPLRTIIFVTLDADGGVMLFQCGAVHDIVRLAGLSAEQALRSAEESDE